MPWTSDLQGFGLTGSGLARVHCTSIVHTSFLVPPELVPELFYNATFKTLQSALEGKGYTVHCQGCGKDTSVLPYNSFAFGRSLADCVISKSSSPLPRYLSVAQPRQRILLILHTTVLSLHNLSCNSSSSSLNPSSSSSLVLLVSVSYHPWPPQCCSLVVGL